MTNMAEYKGSCHCGAVSFQFQCPTIDKAVRCNCSLCKRKGALMTASLVAPEHLVITAEADALQDSEYKEDTTERV